MPKSPGLQAMLALLATLLFHVEAPAQIPQPESFVTCTEGAEPLPIEYGQYTSGCAYDVTIDVDTFTFTGTVGDVIRVSARAAQANVSSLDPQVEIFNPDGVSTASQSCTGGTTVGCCFVLTETLGATGVHTIVVSEFGKNRTGPYTMQLERVPPPNDPPLIGYNIPISDSLSPSTDHDFLRFEGASGTTVRLNASVTSNLDPHVEVFAPDGSKIAEAGCDGNPPVGCALSKDLALDQTGSYLISIRDSGCNNTGSYSLNLQCLVGSCPMVTTTTSTSTTTIMASTTTTTSVSTSTSTTVPAGCATPPAGLVGWWPGDGNAGDIVAGHDGTPQNGATFAPGFVEQAFSLDDNSNQFVEIADTATLRFGDTSPMSVEFWVFRTSASDLQHFLGKRLDCGAGQNGTYQMVLARGGCGVGFGAPNGGPAVGACSGMDLPLSAWTHLAGTFDGTTVRVYINGQLAGEATGPLGPANTAPLLIGGSSTCTTTGGLIDEVKIFDRALDANEIQAIFAAGSAGNCKVSATTTTTATTVTSTVTSTSTTSPTIPPSTTSTTLQSEPEPLRIEGKKLLLKDKPGKEKKRGLMLLAEDASITLGRGNGSADDPVRDDATLRVVTLTGDRFDTTYDLEGRWKYLKKEGANKGYKFKQRPFKSVLVRPGKIKIVAKGLGLEHTLATDPRPVHVVLTLGEQAYCMEFGGGVTFTEGKKYLAKDADAPSACPPDGVQ